MSAVQWHGVCDDIVCVCVMTVYVQQAEEMQMASR